MKKVSLIFIFSLICLVGYTQELQTVFYNGGFRQLNPNHGKLDQRFLQENHDFDRILVFAQFESLPDISRLNELESHGVRLLQYIGNQVYLMSLPTRLLNSDLLTGILSLEPYTATCKLARQLVKPERFSELINSQAEANIVISCDPNVSQFAIQKAFTALSISVRFIHNNKLVTSRVTWEQLSRLAELPFIIQISPAAQMQLPSNRPAATDIRATFVNSNDSGMRNLRGQGMVAGAGDGGFVKFHFDHDTRIINSNLNVYSGFGDHGDHTAGTFMGAGKLSSSGEGVAPMAKLITAQVTDILDSTPSFFNQYGMIASYNSYASGWTTCAAAGIYSVYSNFVDEQLRDNQKVLHFFAASNDGAQTCSPYPAGFGNLASDFNVAKNVVTVGNVDALDIISAGSSRGPAADGRLKPDLCSMGNSVYSTIPTNTYGPKSGTSMAAPGAMGASILLNQRYKQLHSDSMPDGELIKTVLMNTCDDVGNTGPDFKTGYGRINLRRAVETIEAERHISGQINNNDSQSYTIYIPSGLAQVRVMLGWRDKEGSTGAAKSLINDLDLILYTNTGSSFLPWVLDTTKANVNNAPTRARDFLNNHEQVTIDNPSAGTYTIRVKGTSVPYSQQSFFITYEYIYPEIRFVYPIGNEKLVSGFVETVRWDAYGNTTGTWTLSYSLDDGNNWTNIASNISNSVRAYAWTVPTATSKNCLVRILNSANSYADTSLQSFTITALPQNLTATVCDRQVRLRWNTLANASSYDVLILDSTYSWQVVNTTTDTFYTINALKNSIQYAFSIRMRTSTGIVGDRTNAVLATPSATGCGSSSDLGILETLSPVTGRLNTSSALTSSHQVRVYIKNFGTNNISSGVPVYYSINGGTPVSENTSSNINAGNTTLFTFSTTVNLSSVGIYNIKIWTSLSGETNRGNDTLAYSFKQLPNDAVTLPYIETFDASDDITMNYNGTGIPSLTKYDYINNSSAARLRTAAGTRFDNGGSRAITLDKNANSSGTVKNNLILNLNLSAYDTSKRIVLIYDLINHGDEQHGGDSLWIRGADNKNWIKIKSILSGATVGTYTKMASLKLDSVLKANYQNFSSSFQIKFGQEDDSSARMPSIQDGISIDNINLVESSIDAATTAITAPSTNCGLTSAQTVTATFINNGTNNLTSIPVSYSINNKTPVTEYISVLNAGSTTSYSFTTQADLSSPGLYTIKVWTGLSGDQILTNDTVYKIVRNITTVSSFPYIQKFESNDGGFYANNTTTWLWGTPAKSKIKSAANGLKCWVTKISNNYSTYENASLTTGCFDLSSFSSNPILSFNMNSMTENGYDFAYMEYSENGTSWVRLGAMGQGVDWYNTSGNKWTGVDTPWHVASITVPVTSMSAKNKVQFRWVLTSDNATQDEGVAIDDVHIFGSPTTIYEGSATVTGNSNGAGWVTFSSGGQIIASVNDNGNNLGTINCSVFKKSGGIRLKNGQYYLNRSWVISPASQPTSPCTVRLWVTKAELDSLVEMDDYSSSFQQLGITKYSGGSVDSSLSNNSSGYHTYIGPEKVNKIPFNNGYFLEFNVSSFSEFYANSGGSNNSTPLPLQLKSFDVKTHHDDVVINWETSFESQVESYILQRKSATHDWIDIATKSATNQMYSNHYDYLDRDAFKQDPILYYRLKISEQIGGENFSEWRMAQVGNTPVHAIHIFPNPAQSEMNIYLNEGNASGPLLVQVYGVDGKEIIHRIYTESDGAIKINTSGLSPGLYHVTVVTPNQTLRNRLFISR